MRKILLFSLLCFVLFLSACNKDTVADFSFTTQDNETLSLDDLKGKYWIADFIFTNCTTVCLPMTANMKSLQDAIIEKDLDVHLVSFSVDPDYDTPEVLQQYAESYDADLTTWSFLTGYEFDTIKEFSIKSFSSMVHEPVEGDDQVIHGTQFFLVNPEGKIIERYDGIQSSEIENILADLENFLQSS
ncbi:MAG TPA: SCO family protein [Bacillota bacterium]|nr:SCO family protein [Bacillota bacterium]